MQAAVTLPAYRYRLYFFALSFTPSGSVSHRSAGQQCRSHAPYRSKGKPRYSGALLRSPRIPFGRVRWHHTICTFARSPAADRAPAPRRFVWLGRFEGPAPSWLVLLARRRLQVPQQCLPEVGPARATSLLLPPLSVLVQPGFRQLVVPTRTPSPSNPGVCRSGYILP